jgi:hypothetical protein
LHLFNIDFLPIDKLRTELEVKVLGGLFVLGVGVGLDLGLFDVVDSLRVTG